MASVSHVGTSVNSRVRVKELPQLRHQCFHPGTERALWQYGDHSESSVKRPTVSIRELNI